MEQQSTSATPSKRQDYVQYTPQIVTNYNQQFNQQQEQGLASPSHEHYEDSMLELKDVDTLPSNYSFVSHQIPPNTMYTNQPPQQMVMMPPQVPQQVIYVPTETHQRVYEMPSNNNYIHPGMIANPNVPNHLPPSSEPSMSKYTSWTRVVMVFAVILGIYGCFRLISELIMAFTLVSSTVMYDNFGILTVVVSIILALMEIAAGTVGVWSTITKNPKHRKNTTIAHLVLLSLVVIVNIAIGVLGNLRLFSYEESQQLASAGINPQSLTLLVIASILFYVLLIFACCGSCIGCQAYRFRIMTKLQNAQPEAAQGEGFMVMRDEV